MMKRIIDTENFDKRYYFSCEKPETIQPDAFVLFQFYDAYFFQNNLEACEVKWSKRMTSCAGTCKHSSYNSCTITLSEALLQYRNSNELKETLLHEMIHAFLFLTNPKACLVDGGHGDEFKSLMSFINSVTGLNITVYHTFIDEVELFKRHIWKCNGPCSNQPPFYGICKRQMNRPPQKSDFWFEGHQKNCGGEFIKIDGPEFGEDGKIDPSKQATKKTKKERNSSNSENKNVGTQNNKKQKKGEKVDNLQSLISKFLITTPEQTNQNLNKQQEISNFNNNNQKQIKTKNDKENTSFSEEFSLEDFTYKKNKNSNSFIEEMQKKYGIYDQSTINNSNSFIQSKEKQISSTTQKLSNTNNQGNQQNQQFLNGLNKLKEENIQSSQNKININQKTSLPYFENTSKEIIEKQPLKSLESKQSVHNYFQSSNSIFSDESQNNLQWHQNYSQIQNPQNILEMWQPKSNKENQDLQINMDNMQIDDITLSQVKIQVAFTRDQSFNKDSYFIYLFNSKTNLLVISEFLQKLYSFNDNKYPLKHVISEVNGKDDKLDNFPELDLFNITELYHLLFDFGNLKIYFKEQKRMPLLKEQIQSSQLFQKAIIQPQLQQSVNLKK